MSQPLGEFWRLPRVEAEIGLKKSYIYQHERQGRFPARIKCGRAAVWSSREIMEWKAAQAEGRTWAPTRGAA